MTIDELLEDARRRIEPRLDPGELAAALERGALVVDIRPVEQQSRDGVIRGAVIIDRNVLEWRLDPTSPNRIEQIQHHDHEVIIVCNEGYASSLAAATLRDLGLHRATDLAGGFQSLRQ